VFAKLGRHAGNIDPTTITATTLAQWRDAMRDSGLKASSVNHYLSALTTFLSWLVAEGELAEVPAVRWLRAPRASITPADVYAPDQLAKLATGAQATCQGRSPFDVARDTAMLSLLQDSGIRASECAGLLLTNVDLPARQALVHAEIAKAGYPRTVCFGFTTARALAKYVRVRADHEFAWCPEMFVGRRGPATYHLVYRVIANAGRRGGVDGARAHRYRHTWAHGLKVQGADPETLMALGGWRSLAMVARYGQSARADRAIDAYKRMGSPVDRATIRKA
jgi:integrase